METRSSWKHLDMCCFGCQLLMLKQTLLSNEIRMISKQTFSVLCFSSQATKIEYCAIPTLDMFFTVFQEYIPVHQREDNPMNCWSVVDSLLVWVKSDWERNWNNSVGRRADPCLKTASFIQEVVCDGKVMKAAGRGPGFFSIAHLKLCWFYMCGSPTFELLLRGLWLISSIIFLYDALGPCLLAMVGDPSVETT